MKIEACRCPNCGGEVKFLDNKDFVFCTYCGTQIHKNDGTQKMRYDIRQHKVNENIDYTAIHESDNDFKTTVLCFGFLLVLIMLMGAALVIGKLLGY